MREKILRTLVSCGSIFIRNSLGPYGTNVSVVGSCGNITWSKCWTLLAHTAHAETNCKRPKARAGTIFKRPRLVGEKIVSTVGSCDNKLLAHLAHTLKIPQKDRCFVSVLSSCVKKLLAY
jgi:hypothetical protein